MQEKIQTLIASLSAEALENKSKAFEAKQLRHQDLDISSLNHFLSHEASSRWIQIEKKAIKLFSICTLALRRIVKKCAHLLAPPLYPFWNHKASVVNLHDQNKEKESARRPLAPNTCVIAVPHYSVNDAVCNDTLMIRNSLRMSGLDAHIFAHTFDRGLAKELISKSRFKTLLSSSKTLLIYNHCVFWPSGMDFIAKAKGPVWFRYHNVTPPEFFAPHDPISAFATRKGREQTDEILKNLDSKITRYIPVSPFNLRELETLGANTKKLSLIPPFHKLGEFEKCPLNEELGKKLRDGKVNVLFVGRVVPNKGFERLLSTVQKYVEFYGTDIRLIFAGGLSDNFKSYYKHLFSLINEYKLSQLVHWTGKIDFRDLHTYYECSHVFLLLSQHEGFCLPILEAQLHKLPIIAVEGTAIHDTMGEGQLCFPNFDPATLAAAIHRVSKDSELREELSKAGLMNLQKYSIDTLSASLLEQMRTDA